MNSRSCHLVEFATENIALGAVPALKIRGSIAPFYKACEFVRATGDAQLQLRELVGG